MEELDLKDMLSYFINKKVYVIFITLLALLIGIIYITIIQKPMYKSDTTILLTKEYDNSSITSNDIALNQKLVDAYRVIIKSRKVINKVITNLNLEYDFKELYNNISVESINDTEIIKITVYNKSNILACNIANEIANVFNSEIVRLYDIQNIGVVDEAEIEEVPYNVSIIKHLLLATFIGLILGLGIVFTMYYFDNTVKSAEEVENKLGLPIIGTIPQGGK